MAKAGVAIRVTKGKGFVLDELQQLISDWDAVESGAPIDGALRVNGHDYWWVLEYGSGSFFKGEDGELKKPTSIRKGAKGQSQWLIRPRKNRKPFRDKKGRLRKPTLKLRPAPGAKAIYPVGVVVSGQGASVGVVRAALAEFDRRLSDVFERMNQDEFPPTRTEIVAAINANLAELLMLIQATTPTGWNVVGDTRTDEHEADHLADAWSVKLAR